MTVCIIVPESPYLFNQWTIEPLGALYLAGAAKEAGHEACVRVWGREDIPDAEWYGISVVTPHYGQVREIVDRIRSERPRSKIILGGAHCTFLPLETYADLRPDFLVAGEGEIALQRILADSYHGVTGIYTRDSAGPSGLAPIPDLQSLPIPDHSLLLHDYYPNPAFSDERGGAIMASRGCPYGCSYCGKSVGRKTRWRAPSQVAEELKVYKQWRFEDDDLFGDHDWFREFVGLAPPDIGWRGSIRADSVTNEILRLARLSGCKQLGLGVETASPSLLKRHCPSKSVGCATEAISRIKRHNIKVTAFLIAGLPGETDETMQETIDWILEVKPDKFTVSACTPYPGSPLYRHPNRYGILNLEHTNWGNYRQLGREEEDTAFVFDTKEADRYKLHELWLRLREVAAYGIAKDERA